jgi:hypothetical protein
MHRSSAQVKDGVLCRDVADPDRFYLIGEWRSVDGHRALLKEISARYHPKFFDLLEEPLSPNYGRVVSARRPSTSPRSITQNSASYAAPFYLHREDNDHVARIDHRNTYVAEHRG